MGRGRDRKRSGRYDLAKRRARLWGPGRGRTAPVGWRGQHIPGWENGIRLNLTGQLNLDGRLGCGCKGDGGGKETIRENTAAPARRVTHDRVMADLMSGTRVPPAPVERSCVINITNYICLTTFFVKHLRLTCITGNLVNR